MTRIETGSTKSETSRMLYAHMPRPPGEEAWSQLLDRLDPHVIMTSGTQLPQQSIDVLVEGRPSAEQITPHGTLQALVIPYAGVPKETRDLLLSMQPDLAVYNLHHNATAAAELALALFLTAAKTLIPIDRFLRSGDWRSRYDGAPLMLLANKTAVILGFGAIGSRIATICHAFGMTVHAVRRRTGKPSSDPRILLHGLSDLPGLLPHADALFIALPLTPKTEGLIGKEELQCLKRSSVLVNIARGPIVDEEALFLALKEARIAAAGIDVWYNYPDSEESRSCTAPSRFPFHQLDNVVMSPHRGGAFQLEELEQQRMIELAGTLNAIARGVKPEHRVDLAAGY